MRYEMLGTKQIFKNNKELLEIVAIYKTRKNSFL